MADDPVYYDQDTYNIINEWEKDLKQIKKNFQMVRDKFGGTIDPATEPSPEPKTVKFQWWADTATKIIKIRSENNLTWHPIFNFSTPDTGNRITVDLSDYQRKASIITGVKVYPSGIEIQNVNPSVPGNCIEVKQVGTGDLLFYVSNQGLAYAKTIHAIEAQVGNLTVTGTLTLIGGILVPYNFTPQFYVPYPYQALLGDDAWHEFTNSNDHPHEMDDMGSLIYIGSESKMSGRILVEGPDTGYGLFYAKFSLGLPGGAKFYSSDTSPVSTILAPIWTNETSIDIPAGLANSWVEIEWRYRLNGDPPHEAWSCAMRFYT